MKPSEPEALAFVQKARAKKDWSPKDFLLFCKEAIGLAKKYPHDKDKLAYEIVAQGTHFGGFGVDDPDDLRQEIRDLAAGLELPDYHVYTGNGLSVQQQWRLMEDLVNEGLEEYSD